MVVRIAVAVRAAVVVIVVIVVIVAVTVRVKKKVVETAVKGGGSRNIVAEGVVVTLLQKE